MKNKQKQLKIKKRTQVEVLEDLKPKEQAKPINDKSNNQSRATAIFTDLINKRKNLMNELYESADNNKLYFEHVGPTKYVKFYEYMDSKELFDKLKNGQLKFDDALERQKQLLNKINDVKIGKKAPNK